MIRFRTMSDGTIVAPKRGKPPPCPEGYEPIAGNPYTFRATLDPCIYRTLKDSGCCDKGRHCSHPDINKFVTLKECQNCGL